MEEAAAGARSAWRLAQVLLGDAMRAADTVTSVLDEQLAWLAPPSDVELLTAVAFRAGPAAAPAVGAGLWGLEPEARAAVWLVEVGGHPVDQGAQILSLAPHSVATLVAEGRLAVVPGVASERCPDDDQLTRYVAGTSPPTSRNRTHAHLRRCGACRARLAHRTAGLSVADIVSHGMVTPDDDACTRRVDDAALRAADAAADGASIGDEDRVLLTGLDRRGRWRRRQGPGSIQQTGPPATDPALASAIAGAGVGPNGPTDFAAPAHTVTPAPPALPRRIRTVPIRPVSAPSRTSTGAVAAEVLGRRTSSRTLTAPTAAARAPDLAPFSALASPLVDIPALAPSSSKAPESTPVPVVTPTPAPISSPSTAPEMAPAKAVTLATTPAPSPVAATVVLASAGAVPDERGHETGPAGHVTAAVAMVRGGVTPSRRGRRLLAVVGASIAAIFLAGMAGAVTVGAGGHAAARDSRGLDPVAASGAGAPPPESSTTIQPATAASSATTTTSAPPTTTTATTSPAGSTSGAATAGHPGAAGATVTSTVSVSGGYAPQPRPLPGGSTDTTSVPATTGSSTTAPPSTTPPTTTPPTTAPPTTAPPTTAPPTTAPPTTAPPTTLALPTPTLPTGAQSPSTACVASTCP